MKKSILPIVLVAVIVVGGVWFITTRNNDKANTQNSNTIAQQPTNKSPNGTGASYTDYSQDAVTAASAKDKIVLFFHASWCPTCKVLEKDIMNNSDDIPDNVHIMKVDYDTETDLKKKYGVRLQHTLVQVDNSGQKITSWGQSPTLSDLLSRVQ